MRIVSRAFLFLLLLGSLMMAQDNANANATPDNAALDNAAVVKMTKAGLGEDVIVSMVQNQPGHYDLTPDTLVSLKNDGVSDKVMAAMAAKNAAPAVPAAKADPYEDLDVGVYYKVKDVWTPVPTESVNWKTGGVLKAHASLGIVKGDVNGMLAGPKSTTDLRSPLEFLIKTPDGVEGTDFQLVKMHTHSDSREFRTVTGGVFHASGGSTRDAVKFEQTRIAKRAYQITFPDSEKLLTGEYGFLAPGITSSTASGSTGKAYTFHFLE
jgi:hypothetical protein